MGEVQAYAGVEMISPSFKKWNMLYFFMYKIHFLNDGWVNH